MKLEQALPRFRKDLKLFRGPDAEDGSPTYSLYDPISAQYYQVTWGESQIFERLRPGMTAQHLIAEIDKKSTLKVTEAEIIYFFQEAAKLGLLESRRLSDEILEESEKKKVSFLKSLVLNYLFIKIPLINPDTFLDRTLRYVQPLVSTGALWLYGLLIGTGLILLMSRFDEFVHTFLYFFTWKGLLAYGLGISFVKMVHEFSHAYVAKYYRVHVPTMGIAFLVLWPVLYTDITDSWKLWKRRQRLAITIAGMASELVLAGLCTLGWVLSPPGVMQSLFFIVASVTWISSLLINVNPAMRFDGYYLLSDLWGIDNLHAKAFTTARWQIRKWLLGLDVPPPDENISPTRRLNMVLFSIYTWTYRLILYTAIAAFVYFEFTKLLGIVLFAVEVAVFIIGPFVSEAKQLYLLRNHFTPNWRLKLTLTGLAIASLWFIIPYPHIESFPAITVPAQNQVVYVPYKGVIETLAVKRGDLVKAGQVLVKLISRELDSDILQTEKEIEAIGKELLSFEKKDSDHPYIPEKLAEQASAEARLKGLYETKSQLEIRATFDGKVYQWDELLREGQAVARNHVLGKIATAAIKVVSFVPEYFVDAPYVGQDSLFVLRVPRHAFEGKIEQINPVRSKLLNYPGLASIYGGEIPVTEEKKGELSLVESYYTFTIVLEASDYPLRFGQRGEVEIRGPWRSKANQIVQHVRQVLWKESGF